MVRRRGRNDGLDPEKDFLLIYRVDDAAGKGGTIVFARAGTHSDLFGE